MLGIGNVSKAVMALDDDEKSYITIGNVSTGTPKRTTVNESGLYALIMKSRKPEARAFRKWVTDEVLPAIRETAPCLAWKFEV